MRRRVVKLKPKKSFDQAALITIALLLIGAGLLIVKFGRAAGLFISIQPEVATKSGPVATCSDAAASGGQSVKFGVSSCAALSAKVVAPQNGQNIDRTKRYTLASTTTGSVDRVEFYIDDRLIGQATPGLGWNYNWDPATVALGGHKIQAKAYSGTSSVLSAFVLFNVVNPPPPPPPGQIISWGQTVSLSEGGSPRMGKLSDGSWRLSAGHGAEVAVYKSTNNARNWTQISTFSDNGRRIEGESWLQLPNRDLLVAGRDLIDGVSYRISVWRSTDLGLHWGAPVTVDSNENPNGAQNRGLWEPFLFFLPDGRVSILYADETHADQGFNQLISQRVSGDGGRTWGPRTNAAAAQDGHARPGMPVIARMTNGAYICLFEAVGSDAGIIHYKKSGDGLTWTNDLGNRIANNLVGGPGVVSLSDGRIVVTADMNSHPIYFSNDFGNTWKPNDSAFTDGSWPSLYEIQPGEIAATVGGPTRIRFGAVAPR